MRTKKNNPIDWLFPEARKKTLALLLGDPDRRWYLRDIERRTGLAIGTVRRELTGLAKAEIISKTKDGNRTYYQANRGCPFFPDLAGLLRKTAGVVEVLSECLEPLARKIEVAFVHGSFAKGAVKAGSDVDLIVIGSCSFGEAVDAIGKAQDKLAREVNPSVYPVGELKNKVAGKHHFLTTVLNEPKIFVVGDENDLRRLAQ
ncbi:MAG: nucleotidyltransferase domain-containing protein [Phycisphaerales bacterium]|nr:MAG: nucleotidyltransferase domain-containing protein [Phycisphaerales bacterium]